MSLVGGRWPQFANGDSLGWGNVNRASVFGKELVALQPDVILAQGTPVTAALKRETRTIPIVFATVLAKRRAETYDCVETC
jgi:ABC-type uncharacterized transport system substrate-binding protein